MDEPDEGAQVTGDLDLDAIKNRARAADQLQGGLYDVHAHIAFSFQGPADVLALAAEVEWLRHAMHLVLEFGEGDALAIADEALGHTVHGQWMGREAPER